ncbi:hypothetical protein Dacsa_1311 [Dactylococcopsis salina PCC 8305]|uniref:Uncharacterized protein n=2 Tax=Dactylococcopsis salina TaxID=292566 RepID=K9YSU2_DACS8|nr:hypothetical protein Dacsa_1311 [Dactylococcopsis salina PCC 8305]
MYNKLLSNQLLIFLFSCSFLFSCTNPPTEESNTEETQQETNSETVQVDETKESDRGCPEKPGKLEASNVEKVSLDGNETTVSGQLTADEALGYAFEGKEEQKLSYSSDDEFCMWVLTPDNDVLEGLELPKDGSYVVQIAIPKGAKTFELAISLEQQQSSYSLKASSISPEQSEYSKPHNDVSSLISEPSDIYNSIIDQLADQIFYERHPEFDGRKIQPHETAFIQEWKQIRNCEAIVDYKFYDRYPELRGKKIQPGQTRLAQEWLSIKRRVSGCN